MMERIGRASGVSGAGMAVIIDTESETSHVASLERALSGKSPMLPQVRPEDYL